MRRKSDPLVNDVTIREHQLRPVKPEVELTAVMPDVRERVVAFDHRDEPWVISRGLLVPMAWLHDGWDHLWDEGAAWIEEA